jgi:hypothetical protein
MADTSPTLAKPSPAGAPGEIAYRNETLDFAAKIAAEPNTTDEQMSKLGDMIRRDADEIFEALLARRRRS